MNVGILGNQLWVDVNKLLKFQKKEFFFKKKCIILQTAIQFVFILPMYCFFKGKRGLVITIMQVCRVKDKTGWSLLVFE